MSLINFTDALYIPTEEDRINQIQANANQGRMPTVDDANLAARYGFLRILQWFSTFNPPLYPDRVGITAASENGQWKVLQFLTEKGLKPDQDWVNPAVQNGQLDAMVWAIQQGVYPDIYVVDEAARRGYLEIIQFLSRLPNKILPSEKGFALARQYGECTVVDWLDKQGVGR